MYPEAIPDDVGALGDQLHGEMQVVALLRTVHLDKALALVVRPQAQFRPGFGIVPDIEGEDDALARRDCPEGGTVTGVRGDMASSHEVPPFTISSKTDKG